MFSAKHRSKKSEIGTAGEDMACRFLKDEGYTLILQNYRKPFGEIDVIAKAPNGALIFVEVKTMTVHSLTSTIETITPEDQMTISKLKKLRRICALFSAKHPELIEEKNGWQIDLICVSCSPEKLLTNNYKNCFIKHYKNIG